MDEVLVALLHEDEVSRLLLFLSSVLPRLVLVSSFDCGSYCSSCLAEEQAGEEGGSNLPLSFASGPSSILLVAVDDDNVVVV